jgi:hypothetical protein
MAPITAIVEIEAVPKADRDRSHSPYHSLSPNIGRKHLTEGGSVSGLVFVQTDSGGLLEGLRGEDLLRSGSDVSGVVEQCLSHRVSNLLLYAANLPDRFFDLSSGQAGAILQKLFQYRIRVAIVRLPDDPPLSKRFGEMMAEEKGRGRVALFDSVDAARAWLTTPNDRTGILGRATLTE